MRNRLLAALLALPLWSGSAWALSAGDAAPDFVLPDAQGRVVTLSGLRGQFVYVDFWASWCGPCRQSFPWMNRLAQLSRKSALKIVAVNVDEDAASAKAFLQQLPASFTVLYDPAGQVATRYQLPGMPTSFLIGPEGKVRWVHIGFRAGDEQVLHSKLLQDMGKSLESHPAQDHCFVHELRSADLHDLSGAGDDARGFAGHGCCRCGAVCEHGDVCWLS